MVRQMPARFEPPPCGQPDLKRSLITDILTHSMKQVYKMVAPAHVFAVRVCCAPPTQRQLKISTTAVFLRRHHTS